MCTYGNFVSIIIMLFFFVLTFVKKKRTDLLDCIDCIFFFRFSEALKDLRDLTQRERERAKK